MHVLVVIMKTGIVGRWRLECEAQGGELDQCRTEGGRARGAEADPHCPGDGVHLEGSVAPLADPVASYAVHRAADGDATARPEPNSLLAEQERTAQERRRERRRWGDGRGRHHRGWRYLEQRRRR